MPRCKSGDRCERQAVAGDFCREHGDQLKRIASEFNSRKRSTKAVTPKPPPEKRVFEKLPIEVRMKRITDYVARADGPVTREEAAKAAGLSSADGSLGRIVARAVELGLLQTRRGRRGGLTPGSRLAAEP